MEGTAEIYVRVPVSLKAWLQDYADRNDTNQKAVVLSALEEYRKKHDPQAMRPRGK